MKKKLNHLKKKVKKELLKKLSWVRNNNCFQSKIYKGKSNKTLLEEKI